MRTGRIGPLGSTCSESLAGLWPDFDARSLLVTSTLTKMPPTSSATSAPRSSCMISNDHPGSPCGQLPHRCCADTRRATSHHCASCVDVHYDTHASSTRRHPLSSAEGLCCSGGPVSCRWSRYGSNPPIAADGDAPQHAYVTGLMVPVRQLADSMGRLHQCGFVVEVSQCEWRAAHQRPVARSAASDFVRRRRLRTCCRLT
jgi:hypothetical protein